MAAKRIVQQPAASLPSDYAELLEDLKARIRTARVQAALAVNRELVLLYWDIGRSILERQQQESWGAKVIERLTDDLRREFPDMKRLSRANLFYMRAFAEAYPDREFVQQVAGQLPWFHNVTCKERNRVVVEYALRDVSKPLGVAEYRLAQALPAELQGALPSVEELEAELAKLDEGNLEEEGYGG